MLKASLNDSCTHCIFCGELKNESPSWSTLLPLAPPSLLCERCNNELEEITEPGCTLCSRPLLEKKRCEDCARWEEDPNWEGVLDHNQSLYRYNAHMQEIIAKWKYRGDAVLALIFSENIRQLYLRTYTDYIPVPIPLSSKRLQERGFNQSQLLADFTNTRQKWWKRKSLLPVTSFLERTLHEEKQSKKSRRERLASKQNPFHLSSSTEISISSKKFVLFDDIYTTGTTVRKAAQRLKEQGASKVCSITLARG
ncbi:ComF family protein [Alteribacillus sp. JSM 102045]|uniref:ComF family protein n=1 Tax=Alteribacillus sp. JSM 102045 TaxID=1562101 RepID=UPI0035BFBDF6